MENLIKYDGVPIPEDADWALKGKKTSLRGLYEALIMRSFRTNRDGSETMVEARKRLADLFDQYGPEGSKDNKTQLDDFLSGASKPATKTRAPRKTKTETEVTAPEVAPEVVEEVAEAPTPPSKPRPPRKPRPTPETAEPAPEKEAPLSESTSADFLDIMSKLGLGLDTPSPEQGEESKGAGSRQAPTTGQSQLSPDTMAEIFDRYALLAQYRKAISEGRMSIPLEYSSGGVANRYNASIEEIMQALELMGFTPEELA
jgi:hypothetical protein